MTIYAAPCRPACVCFVGKLLCFPPQDAGLRLQPPWPLIAHTVMVPCSVRDSAHPGAFSVHGGL